MKRLFIILFATFTAALILTRLSEPDVHSEVPIIYWVIDPAPVRPQHIRLFENWQVKNGHCTEHTLTTPAEVRAFRQRRWSPVIATAIRETNELGAAVLDGTIAANRLPVTIRVPKCEMRLDASSNDMSKKIVQSVSGIASDVMEVYGDGNVQFMASGGLIADVTEDAARLGFGPETTYPGLETSITYLGRQYSYPRNPVTQMLWVNKEVFKKYGMELPPRRWTFEEFERIGKEFMAKANPPGERRTVFFANDAPTSGFLRSMGLDVFNETMTRSVLNDPRTAELYRMLMKWEKEDHLFPTAAERSGFATEAGGWGGGDAQLFAAGKFAMITSGRYQLMQFREFKEPIQLAVVEPPHGGWPVNLLFSGQGTVYAGSKNRDLAVLFLAFYASEDYSMQIVGDGDGLPPRPKYAELEEFKRPKDFPNEWGCHEVFAEDALEAIGPTFSPFVQYNAVQRCQWTVSGAVDADRLAPEAAAKEVEDRINRQIDLRVAENPALKKLYDEACAIQEQIDARRSAGQPVPRPWVTNPFHRKLYEKNGWFEDQVSKDAATKGNQEEIDHAR